MSMQHDDPVIAKLRTKCLQRAGKNGIRELSRQFRIMDDNNNLLLSPDELRGGLRDFGIVVADEEFDHMVKLLDKNGDGSISVTEFLIAVRGPLSPRRITVIQAAFKRLDRDGSGIIDLYDLRDYYDVSRHPAVLTGKATQADVLVKFLCNFDSETNPDGKVTFKEFLDYYAGVSASIDNDQHFELLLTRAWNLDKPVKAKRDEIQMRQTQTVKSKYGTAHPLYQTSTKMIGKDLDQAFPPERRFGKAGKFTKHEPLPSPSSGLNTSVTRSKVI